MSILVQIVEDDLAQSTQLEKIIHREGYETIVHATADAAISWLKLHIPQICLLDINLDEYGMGYAVLAILAREDVPTITMTSRDTVAGDTFASIMAGTVYYLHKPYNHLLLLKTLRNIIRTTYPEERGGKTRMEERQIIDDLWLTHKELLLVDRGQDPTPELELPRAQTNIFRAFADKGDAPISRAELISRGWDDGISDRSFYTLISRLNSRLEGAGFQYRIENTYKSRDPYSSTYRLIKRTPGGD